MNDGAIQIPRPAAPPVRVSSSGPFAVGSILWRDAWGKLTCTVVAKATYELGPGESAPLEVPNALQQDDAHWDDDPSRSVHVPGDLAPFKRSAEVVVVGSAFAMAPVASLIARVLVGPVDKSIEAFPPRRYRADGVLEPGTPLASFPLRYEHAAGGPGTDNPPGVDVARADGRGRLALPQLLPPFHPPATPGAHVPTCGFGPIASSWPSRAALLGPNEHAWLRRPTASPLPRTFPASFFQVAPADQWLDRPLAANERIVLEGLHPDIGRLVMSLSGLEPRAVVARGVPEAIRLTADLLFVDTDRGTCTLTYRGCFPVDGGAGALRVIVLGVPCGSELSPEEVHRIVGPESEDVETTHVEGIVLDPPAPGATQRELSLQARPVLPFVYEPSPRPPQPSNPDGALPFRSHDGGSLPYPPGPVGADMAAPPKPSEVIPAPAVDPLPPPPPPRRAMLPSASFDAAFGGLKAASDAAANVRPAVVEAPRERPNDPFPVAAASPASAYDGGSRPQTPARRQAVVSLLCFEPRIVPRLRTAKRFAAALAPKARPRRAQGLDEPHQEAPPDDRADVLRVLSWGQPAEASEIHRALADSLDDLDDLDPPLLLVAGELRPTFDELEVLRATVAVAQQVAGGDKKILSAVAVGQEALGAPVAPRTETTLGLVRQIEQAAGALSLPPRYVPAEVERVLVEGRKYKRRLLLGAPRVRADLTPARGGEVLPLYLPETAASSLPLLLSFPVVALCEVSPREDLTEAQPEALFAAALGRVLRSR